MPRSEQRSELKNKFVELNTKYQALVMYATQASQPMLKIYENVLEDITELENICIKRGRY